MTTAPISTLLGSAARAPFVLLKQFRPHRPIHSEGVGLEGVLTRTGGGSSGIHWIDEAGEDPVRARFSRSFGFPRDWPDILGLALRCPVPPSGQMEGRSDGRADLLLATAGSGRLSRFVPTIHRCVPDGAFASFMPYRGLDGPVLVAAHPEPRSERLPARPDRFRASVAAEPWVLGLHWATPLGPWQRFGTVELGPGAPFGDDERFDPLLNVPTGAENYEWTCRLREPSYTLALVEETGALAGLSVEGARQGPVPASFGTRDDTLLPHVREQLGEYFGGRLQEFDADVVLHGTPFQLRVWNALARIPYGTTGTYGQVARAVGAPRAAQAVGAANGRNPVSLLVPCHRIIGANGRLTGYAGGMERKEYLLRLEGALL